MAGFASSPDGRRRPYLRVRLRLRVLRVLDGPRGVRRRQIVLTEIDADELEEAREFLDRGGFTDRAAFEHGDAIETVENYDGPFDVVLVDNEKHRYAEAFELSAGKCRSVGRWSPTI